ncbi:NHS-like protein 3 [Mantella aurantiaca]
MSGQTALPPDSDSLPPVPDLGALEPKKKKHKSGTLRRALSWLRGRKKKKPEAKQQESKENSKPGGQLQLIPSQEDENPDNAFFPSKRTALLEDIHCQAQEGLKSLQRREKHHGKYPFEEENKNSEPSIEVNEEDVFRTRSLSCSTENTDDAMSVRSEMIQRKGSTFRPHDSPSWPSSKTGRRRKEKRATVVGVPHHIAAELGLHTPSLHRGIHELFFKGEKNEKATTTPKVNGVQRDGEEYVVIPTVDGMPAEARHNGAHISLAAVEQTEAALQRHIEKVYQDDSCIGWKTSQKISPLLIRPKSVAVPGMTTHSPQSDPVSPVMSISPQGTYMSKIIPNAVLPPMVDVVALSRSSVRTLSRCSLATASPASVRGSLHRGRGMSTSSDTWSRSQSTETIVSDSSTISSRGGENTLDVGEKHESELSTGRASPAPSTGTQDESDAASLCSGRSSVRSVSLRKSKKAPPPPKRTYSLQQQREMGLPPRPEKKPTTKSSNTRDPWVPRSEKATVENEVFLPKVSSPTRSDRTLSPSSGYSSQSGTPTLPVRSLLESPGTRRRTPPKPERSSLKSASSINAASLSAENSPLRDESSMGDQEGQDLIPPHPNVPAPTCPPPIQSIGLVVTPVATPAPSPPPSHHPTPPPVRKSETDTEIPPSALEEVTQKESLWPPPPPEAPDVQELSMADFPPPEEELFLPPPPSLETVSKSVTSLTVNSNDSKEMTEAEKPLLIPKNEMPLDIVEIQTDSVPLTNSKPSDTAVNYVNSETKTTTVLDSEKAIKQPAVPPTIEAVVLPPVAVDSEESLIRSIEYKPHFVATALTETADPEEKLEISVPQKTLGDQSVSKQEPKVSTDNSTSTAPQPLVDSSASVMPSPTVTTKSALSPSGGSPLHMSNVWKPVSAPSSRKSSITNQVTTAQPKEDASLPIVTPSLLQMVRLRSVQARGPQMPFSQLPSGIPAPQKPVRKSLSIRSSQGSDSSQGESPTSTQTSPSSQKPPDSPSAHRSPASAASFVFARGSKKFVFEPHVSQEADSSLKRDLVSEFKPQGGPRSPDGKPPIQRKPSKIPPPVARKPSVGIPRTPTSPSCATGSTNGNIVSPQDAVSVPPLSGTRASGTLENHEQQHKSPMEQA